MTQTTGIENTARMDALITPPLDPKIRQFKCSYDGWKVLLARRDSPFNKYYTTVAIFPHEDEEMDVENCLRNIENFYFKMPFQLQIGDRCELYDEDGNLLRKGKVKHVSDMDVIKDYVWENHYDA
jgi:hypothetical protein